MKKILIVIMCCFSCIEQENMEFSNPIACTFNCANCYFEITQQDAISYGSFDLVAYFALWDFEGDIWPGDTTYTVVLLASAPTADSVINDDLSFMVSNKIHYSTNSGDITAEYHNAYGSITNDVGKYITFKNQYVKLLGRWYSIKLE
jgi:hypothetical protein